MEKKVLDRNPTTDSKSLENSSTLNFLVVLGQSRTLHPVHEDVSHLDGHGLSEERAFTKLT